MCLVSFICICKCQVDSPAYFGHWINAAEEQEMTEIQRDDKESGSRPKVLDVGKEMYRGSINRNYPIYRIEKINIEK